MVTMAAEAGAFLPGWGLFLIQRSEDGTVLGGIGFHGPPADGSAEIGYELTELARGAGWATDAVVALSHRTLSLPSVHTLLATTEPGNQPSQRVLSRAGFTRVADRDALWAYELTAGFHQPPFRRLLRGMRAEVDETMDLRARPVPATAAGVGAAQHGRPDHQVFEEPLVDPVHALPADDRRRGDEQQPARRPAAATGRRSARGPR